MDFGKHRRKEDELAKLRGFILACKAEPENEMAKAVCNAQANLCKIAFPKEWRTVEEMLTTD